MSKSPLCHDQDKYRYNTFYIIAASISSVQLICSLIVIYSYCRFKKFVSSQYKIVFLLQITDLLYSASNLLFPRCEMMEQYYTTLCYLQAFLNNTTYYSATLFTAIISQILYHTIVKNVPRQKIYSRPYWVLYVFLGYGMPLLLGIIPFCTRSYGIADYWCFFPYSETFDPKYIKYGVDGKEFILPKAYTILQYVIVWAVILHNIVIFIILFHYVCKRQLTQHIKNLIVLSLIPAALFLSWIQPTINRLIINISQNEPKFWLAVVMVSCNSSIGLLNFVVYGLNSSIRKRLKMDFQFLFCSCCCCFRCKRCKNCRNEIMSDRLRKRQFLVETQADDGYGSVLTDSDSRSY